MSSDMDIVITRRKSQQDGLSIVRIQRIRVESSVMVHVDSQVGLGNVCFEEVTYEDFFRDCPRCSFEDMYSFVFSLTRFSMLYYSIEYLRVSKPFLLQITK